MKNNAITIRPEKIQELDAIYHLIKTGFMTAKVSDGNEQDFANQLRESDNYIADLALVAESAGELIGHIMLTKTDIIQTDSQSIPTLLLAPITVKLEYRDQGVGRLLIHEAFKRAKQLGYTSVFLVGDPKYYARFGFKSISEFNIVSSTAIPEPYAMGIELITGSLLNVSGKLAAC